STRLDKDSSTTDCAATVIDDCQRFLLIKELVELAGKTSTTGKFSKAGVRLFAWDLVPADVCQFFFSKALGQRFYGGFHVRIFTEQHDHPGQLAAILGEVLWSSDVRANYFAADHAVGSRCPRPGIGQQRSNIRRYHAYTYVFISPATAEGLP